MNLKKQIKDRPAFLLAAIFLPVGIFLLTGDDLVGRQITDLGGYWARPLTYIRILGAITIALSALLLIKSIQFRRGREYEVKKIAIGWGFEAGMTAAALVAYCIVMPLITFVPATFALVFGMNLLYKRKEGSASPKEDSFAPPAESRRGARSRWTYYLNSAVYALLATFVLYMIFTKLLHAVLP
ncbi:MAG: tripartite tricarboxylate transporter TctB family protein [Clostridiales Family XIII bacterium]|nr:tripartite tricarboxylate transporter TctB family protein [Clostridiales Family XIII bacterium]